MMQHRQGGAPKLYGGYVGGNIREIGINLVSEVSMKSMPATLRTIIHEPLKQLILQQQQQHCEEIVRSDGAVRSSTDAAPSQSSHRRHLWQNQDPRP